LGKEHSHLLEELKEPKEVKELKELKKQWYLAHAWACPSSSYWIPVWQLAEEFACKERQLMEKLTRE
jgi:hypothetical protein